MKRILLHIHHRDRIAATFDIRNLAKSDGVSASQFTPAELEDFAHRFAATLAEETGVATTLADKTQDEDAGHVFHGNQYTDVPMGEKPLTAKSKAVKAGVAELLATGHHFTNEELMKATGATEVKQVMKVISRMKREAKPGELTIETTNGVHKLVKKPADPATAGSPDPSVGAVGAASPPAAAAPPPAPAAAPAKKSKEAADKDYKEKMDSLMNILEPMSKTAPYTAHEHLAQHFKNAKASLMAQWAADATGEPLTPTKPQEVFKADLQLIADLAHGDGKEKALAAWKQNTALEKAGKFPPPTPAAVEAAAEKLADGAPTEVHAPAFPVVKDYVPPSAPKIAETDFDEKTKFVNNMSFLQAKLEAQSAGDPTQNKVEIQKALETRLKSSKAFTALQKAYKAAGDVEYGGSLAARLISQWATSSGDTHALAVAQQIAVRDAFGMNQEDVSSGSMTEMHTGKQHDEKVLKRAAQRLGLKYETPADKAALKAGLHDFVRAQYDETQDFFKKHGIKDVAVARGMKVPHPTDTPSKHKLKLQPASSFSASYQTANSFSGLGNGSIFLARVPVEQVLGTYLTGFGCTEEHEVVVLAHPDTECVSIPAQKASTLGEAQSFISKGLGVAQPAPAVKPLTSASPAVKPLTSASSGYKPVKLPLPPKFSGWAEKMYGAAASGDLGNYEAAKKAFLLHKADKDLHLPTTTDYMNQLDKIISDHNSQPDLPKPYGSGWSEKFHAAAVSGDAEKYHDLKQQLKLHKAKTGVTLPNTTKHLKELDAALGKLKPKTHDTGKRIFIHVHHN